MKKYFNFRNAILLLLIMQVCSSCSSYKNITYFKNISDSSDIYQIGKNIPEAVFAPLKIQTDDILQINISTLDPAVNGALNISSPDASMASLSSSGLAQSLASNSGNSGSGYLVNKEGNIEVPLLGTIQVKGLTISNIQSIVYKKAAAIYKSPVVSVRLSNFKVTVLGEVNKPGSYVVNGERVSVLDALGLASDLTIYGKRENIMLIRQEPNNQKKVVRLNLNSTDMMASPYFYLRQGDVLYVEPSKAKAAATDLTSSKSYAIGASVISLIIIIVSRLKF